ncbi:MAG: hypothetical protein GY727_03840 [Gammaproteobacteria bacterium]|nr:hypothetical protein [Gammaproteobacteria bacterium]MCP4090515.1 hypothetical protein [Gammaproteobacteria bacterium]MCP4831370.1 hypothetical protein [Gammaproteobacteria bacterium]MCP4927914.1 hypothetical protein [Gammaproteobacteria bacterium]
MILWPWEHGYEAFGTDKSLLTSTFHMLPKFLGSLNLIDEALPQLVIDVKFKDMRRIYHQRDTALRKQRLVQTEDSFIRGKIRTREGNTPIKLRLKGDYTDHLRGRKWSFRVHTRKGEQFLGMRRFSVQHPRVRAYQGEALYFAALKYYHVLAPRYFYVDFMLNGEDLGVMAVEEHFSKELLESQRRREGVIVRFDETLLFSGPDGTAAGSYDDYRNSSIDAFQTTKVLESPTLSKHLRTATGMLRSFVRGEISASDVFDVETLGAYLAVSEVFGAYHAMRWHNQRFYVNPITLKLEPIGYDASLHDRKTSLLPISVNEPIVNAMLQDPLVRTRFLEVLQQIAADVTSGELIAHLQEYEAILLKDLQAEFVYLQKYPLEELGNRVLSLAKLDGVDFTAANQPVLISSAQAEAYHYPVHAYRLLEGGSEYLEFQNAISYPVTVNGLITGSPDTLVQKINLPGLPVTLDARKQGAVNNFTRIKLPDLLPGTDLMLQVSAGAREHSVMVHPYYPHQPVPAIPIDDINSVSAKYSFLNIDQQAKVIDVPAGTWTIPELISLPPGYDVTVAAGTNLRFGRDAGLIVRGGMQLKGTVEQPISMVPAENIDQASWLGIAVLEADSPSVWEHVKVEHTRGMSLGPWLLMGGTNFYRSPIKIISSSIKHHHGEDGLNIISTDFDINNLEIADTLSDGFDCDFCDGSIKGGFFHEIGTAGGGDAIDVSLSTIAIDAVRFRNIDDKAISIGEASRAVARNLDIESAGTGAAAKDGSFLRLEQSSIYNSKISALMAYVKKPEFGPATLIAEDLELSNNRTTAVTQTGSKIMLDDELMPVEDVDVDKMYDTIMRPGLRRPAAETQGSKSNAGT